MNMKMYYIFSGFFKLLELFECRRVDLYMYLYTNTVLDGSVILFVRYRNHFPVVQFQS